ncbi:MAG: hypothetical protein KJ645_13505 [Planctomycetes bacterium]|nr:hypothetical protein [Planctomycetota bacterium]
MADKKKEQKDVLVVGSKVKAYIKSKQLMCSGDLMEGLSEKVYSCIDEAIERTKNNKRSTIRPHDL